MGELNAAARKLWGERCRWNDKFLIVPFGLYSDSGGWQWQLQNGSMSRLFRALLVMFEMLLPLIISIMMVLFNYNPLLTFTQAWFSNKPGEKYRLVRGERLPLIGLLTVRVYKKIANLRERVVAVFKFQLTTHTKNKVTSLLISGKRERDN